MVMSMAAFAGYGEKKHDASTTGSKTPMTDDASMTGDTGMATDSVSTGAAATATNETVLEKAEASGQFSMLAKAIKKANLTDTLKGDGPFTIFAPTDEAFNKLPQERLNALMDNPEELRDLLLYHVAPKRVSSTDAQSISEAETVSGRNLAITNNDGNVMIGGAKVISPDITAKNGVIHGIDTVLIPEKLSE